MIELVDYIRLLSKDGRLVTAEQVIAVAGLDLEIEDVKVAHQALIEDSQYQDIAIIAAETEHYFYSKRYIVSSFAAQWIGVKNGKLIETMADYIRRYSAMGELVAATNFTHPPYKLERSELAELMKRFNSTDGCEDIHFQLDANTNETDSEGYYFSIKTMTNTYAKVLAEHDPFEWSA
ncbi:hypothetical protein [Shewanella sp. 10N.286.48.B5]|uniref:hypothetical protein n=1 Tax=Shewanella sp. 10N.286.48.B5 TaxID=1880834 RepID=UPI000C84B0D5|nr:hypothetical protein [Shewanella sp. 10N.286.48.B5]PMH89100.1 hypothetical protein BCU57_18905 [Shewanella sp. 10N.286.48.B5]